MAAEAPALLSQDATGEILLLHTAISVMGIGVTTILLRALLLLRRSGETLPGLLTMLWIMLAMGVSRAAWLGFQWFAKPAPMSLDVLSFLTGFIVVMGIPVLVSAKYLPGEGAYAAAPRPWVWLHRAMVATAVLGFGLFICALQLKTRAVVFLGPSAVCVLTALLLLSRISLYRHLQVRRRPLLLFAACMISGLLLMAAYTTYSFWTGVRIRHSLTLLTLNAISVVLMLCGIIFVFANVRLADVIVKRALRIVLCTCGIVAVWLTLGRCFTLSQSSKPAPSELAGFLILGAALALAPLAERRLTLWVDTWVFEQPDFQASMPLVWRELMELDSQDEVFRAAEASLQTGLRLAAVRIVPLAAAENNAAPLPSRPGAYFVAASSRLAQALSPPGTIVVPLFRDGEADHVIVLSPGVVRPPLTALETGYVERVAGQIQIRLGMLLAEQRRTEQARREALFREELSHAELRALRAQVNPHFLFNSLNTIADLTVMAPAQAEEMTLRLSAVFRYVLVNTDKHFTCLRDEIEFARSYLQIEQTRFGERLQVNFDIDPATLGQTIPTLLLQPLIENALKHGLSPRREGGCLTIRSWFVSDDLSISVSDDGVGLRYGCTEPAKRSTKVGVANVSNRLRTAYGDRAAFTLRSRREGGTEALIVIPRGQNTCESFS